MALNRSPTSVLVNGVALLIKDGDTEAGLFGARFQRVPGLANFTLPDETGSVNETQLQDGPIAAAQIAGVGTITGSIGAITAHPTHKFLAAKRRTGGTIRAVILRPAQTVVSEAASNGVAVSAAIDDGQTAAKDILSVVTLDAARRDIREGFLAAVHTAAPKGHLDYNAAAVADMARFQSVLSINDSGLKFSVSPGVTGAIPKALLTYLYLRKAGILYGQDDGFLCTVNGFGDGDFQAGGHAAANLSLAPPEALPVKLDEWRLIDELASDTGDNYAGVVQSSPGPYDGVFVDLA